MTWPGVFNPPANCPFCGHSPDQHEADHCTRSIETRAGIIPCPCAAGAA